MAGVDAGWVAVRKNGLRSAAPPPRAAGLTQPTCCPRFVVCPDWRLTPCPGRPKRELAGGCDGNVEKAIAHPVWVELVQRGTCEKVAPTVLPMGTCKLPPTMIATTNRPRTDGSCSIWVATRWIRIA